MIAPPFVSIVIPIAALIGVAILVVLEIWHRRRNPDWPMRRYRDSEGREWFYYAPAGSDGAAGGGDGGGCGGDGGGCGH